MPRCPLCGSSHIVLTLRTVRRGYCLACDLEWGLDRPSTDTGTPVVLDLRSASQRESAAT
jgi:hypothetical protein